MSTYSVSTPLATLGQVIFSVFTFGLKYLLKGTIFKLLILTAFLFAVSVFGSMMISMLPEFLSDSFIKSYVDSLPPGLNYFFKMAALDFGLPLLISAHTARFTIRRLPIIG